MEKKIGYNLLLLFIEKINQAKKINNYFYQYINNLNDELFFKLSEKDNKDNKIKSDDLHKI